MSVSQAETTQADLSPEQQARQEVTIYPYVTFNGKKQNYLYIFTDTNTVSVGDRLSVKLRIRTAEEAHREHIKHITYLVRQHQLVLMKYESPAPTHDQDVLITTSPTNPLRC